MRILKSFVMRTGTFGLVMMWTFSTSTCASDRASFDENSSEPVGKVVFAYWAEAPEPFGQAAIPKEHHKGLIREIGLLIADALGREAVFKPLPGGRIQLELAGGNVDMNCLSSPKWGVQPTPVSWTIPIFHGGEGPIMRADEADAVVDIESLIGKRISLYEKYTYDGPLKALVDSGRIEVTLVDTFDRGLELLQLNRIDAHMEFSSVAYSRLEQSEYGLSLELAPLRTDTFGYSCAVADHFAEHMDEINTFIRTSQQNGQISELLQKYHLPETMLED